MLTWIWNYVNTNWAVDFLTKHLYGFTTLALKSGNFVPPSPPRTSFKVFSEEAITSSTSLLSLYSLARDQITTIDLVLRYTIPTLNFILQNVAKSYLVLFLLICTAFYKSYFYVIFITFLDWQRKKECTKFSGIILKEWNKKYFGKSATS